MDQREVALIIPAFNEGANISSVLARCNKWENIIVVDDYSNDTTSLIARNMGATVVRNAHNLGYSRSIEIGLQTAKELGLSYAITLDADGQHDPSDCLQFMFQLDQGKDLVFGIRNSLPRISEKLFAWIFHGWWSISDPLCGMKGYNLAKIPSTKTLGYDLMGLKIALLMIRDKCTYSEVSINETERLTGRSKIGGNIRADVKILIALFNVYLFLLELKLRKLKLNEYTTL